jgi:hypothetical protein
MKAYAYDPETRKLTIQFPDGTVVDHHDVSLERATAFEGAASKGRYFNDQIRGNHLTSKVFDR